MKGGQLQYRRGFAEASYNWKKCPRLRAILGDHGMYFGLWEFLVFGFWLFETVVDLSRLVEERLCSRMITALAVLPVGCLKSHKSESRTF